MTDTSEDSDDQVASQDEYEISLAEGIEDEAAKDEGGTKKFTITSYGADYTIDSLVKRMKTESFRIPEFQRRFVWSQRHASKFIESLLMGLPVPGIFLYKEADTNKHLVVDGQQRLKTLQYFYAGTFGEKKFRLIGIREPWLGKTYEELEASDQLKLDDSIVHATIFRQDQPQDVLDSIYFVFERINSGGIRLSPQEIRNCIAAGSFTNLVKGLNVDSAWRRVFGGAINKRCKDEELIVRFLAMLEMRAKYTRPMAKFLNDFSAAMNKEDNAKLESLKDAFLTTIGMADRAIGSRAFRPARTLNAAVFDSVMVGLSIRLSSSPLPMESDVRKAYETLLEDKDYIKAYERATADEENVKNRISKAISAFGAI